MAENTRVDLAEPEITLDQLVDQITDENRHDEVETRPRVGNEAW